MTASVKTSIKLCPLALLSLTLVLGMQASADPQITFGKLTYNGTGCPEGSSSVTYSPDSKAISVLFDRFTTTVGAGRGPRAPSTGQSRCTLQIPVQVPAGYQVSVAHADFRGFVHIAPSNALAHVQAQFTMQNILRGRMVFFPPIYSLDFRGTTDQDFLLSKTPASSWVEWSQCGGTSNLLAWISVSAQNSTTQADGAMINLDSVDLLAPAVFKMEFKPCH